MSQAGIAATSRGSGSGAVHAAQRTESAHRRRQTHDQDRSTACALGSVCREARQPPAGRSDEHACAENRDDAGRGRERSGAQAQRQEAGLASQAPAACGRPSPRPARAAGSRRRAPPRSRPAGPAATQAQLARRHGSRSRIRSASGRPAGRPAPIRVTQRPAATPSSIQGQRDGGDSARPHRRGRPTWSRSPCAPRAAAPMRGRQAPAAQQRSRGEQASPPIARPAPLTSNRTPQTAGRPGARHGALRQVEQRRRRE